MSDPECFVDIACPYCGEWITLALDLSGGDQHYIEDCQVCCKPISVSVQWDEEGEAQVSARGQDDA
ncbi:CPXCG motif-containing cysteine-rich protein [Xanthomonas campestris]|uniref:CPXCG motif-containing cysteine-rich protein n=1 Tax=Xanthomonas campestris TaxID=339 RepID=UPI000E32692E|nr:CPXCG motif-containing cysteine-rich protein [Xanthomonas campestris]MEA9489917.1 CPXCG motif-containing cysteine-rich protein [Xanthomonas campestris]MEA9508246.1 CPXCG motif-containing cysteine-rich protein [Xanthomonas campestris]MEA9575061.1 CPXCG motif-containing cysteine-rich protein [Xanthomonas campestris]MEA9731301.1 CPXCG motif-containing cysteine-rich protein [Xanthomonas campestris]MEB2111985.1 CPXCG motif-containing cysteine-rich protein [Xanthomonas campestris pv. campestris]